MNHKVLKILTIMSIFSFFSGCKSDPDNPKSDSKKLFLKDIDFSEADYALYVRHKEFGEFMVTDPQALKANKDKLKIKLNFINYLPGEGDRSFGLMLFKNNQLIKNETGGVFNYFEIGNLKDFAVPVKRQGFEGIKDEILQKIDTIKSNKKYYTIYQPDFVLDNRSFRFRIYFPSIAIPITREIDSSGYERIKTVNGIDHNTWIMEKEAEFEKKWAKILEERIRKKAGNITDFEVSISKGSVLNAYLYDNTKNGVYLKTIDNKHLVYISNYQIFDFDAYIMTNEENAEKLFALDYSNLLSKEERNRPQIIAEMKRLVKQSINPILNVDNEEVGIPDYKETTRKNKEIYVQEYGINWLEIKE